MGMLETYQEIMARTAPKPIRNVIAETVKKLPVSAEPKATTGLVDDAYIERLLNRHLKDPTILDASRRPAAQPLAGSSDHVAVSVWIAIHINAWLRAWRGNQYALVNRVELFMGQGDVYARLTVIVGHDAHRHHLEVNAGKHLLPPPRVTTLNEGDSVPQVQRTPVVPHLVGASVDDFKITNRLVRLGIRALR